MATMIITGGSGLIGRAVTKALLAEGHAVRWLSRTPMEASGPQAYAWDAERGTIDASALEGIDHIIHLAGTPIIGRRWTPERLRECERSRAESAHLLLRTSREIGTFPKSFISASGIGYYGALTTDHIFSENDPPAGDTIGGLTSAWENAVDEWSSATRVVKLRTPMVLAREGGALPLLATLARWYLLAPLGNGRQWMPWVHIHDLVRLYTRAVFDEGLSGAYNVCAAGQPLHRGFMRALARATGRPLLPIAVPAVALRLVMGAQADLVLQGSRVSSEKLRATGFRFQYERLDDALSDLI